jgi:hypothetical protein
MFKRILTPTATIDEGMVIRRSGLCYAEKIALAEIDRVIAVVKDALTNEEIVVVFSDGIHDRVWLSEFDRNFSDVMSVLARRLPGFVLPDGLAGAKAFDKAQRVLWERSRTPIVPPDADASQP